MSIAQLRERSQNGELLYSAFLTIPNAWTAELMARQGYDALVLDLQHGLSDFAMAVSMLQAIGTTQTIPLVRLPWNDPAMAMHLLDAGAAGLICPMINTAEDTNRFVEACRYPPQGYRSFGPIRARHIDPEEFRNPLTFAMVETAAAVDNLEAIASVPGLDGLFVGPFDLSISLGLNRLASLEEPVLLSALDRVLGICREKGLIPGIYTQSTVDAHRLASMGFRLISHSDDSTFLVQQAQIQLKSFREFARTL